MTSLCKAVEAGHLEVVQLLLEKGASTDVPDNKGETCVHLAVRHGSQDILRHLVRRGANPDIISYDGQSALHLAVSGNDSDSVNILLRAGALVNIRSHHLVTPLMLAAGSAHEDILTSLLEFDARLEEEDKDGHSAFYYARHHDMVLIIWDIIFQEKIYILIINSILDTWNT